MTAHISARQPFAALDCPRLHTLASTKNRQNSIPASFSIHSSAAKPVLSSPQKRRYSPSSFDDDYDSENVHPSQLSSPAKRSKSQDASPHQAPKFVLSTASSLSSSLSSSSSRFATPSSPISQQNKTRSVPIKSPISTSRGSPKHKRVGILSKRRTSSSPFTRVDPPAFGRSSRRASGLPFSIDAALSGSIPTYSPKPAVSAPIVPTLDEAMPKGWFFEIHEDTDEQEATNLMEHSACTLDISSDDDCDAKARNEASERGKENIPPPDFVLANPTVSSSTASTAETTTTGRTHEIVKPSKPRRKYDVDVMQEDRSPLSDLPVSDYFGEGLNASSHVVVDGEKASALSRDCTSDIVAASSDDVENAQPGDAGEDAGDQHSAENDGVDREREEKKEVIAVYDEDGSES